MKISRLGDLLNQMGLITAEELERALQAQAEKGERLGQVLLQQKKISEPDLIGVLAAQFGMEERDSIPDESLRFDLVHELPIQYLKKNLFFPFQTEDGALWVAVNDPLNLEILDDFRVLFGREEVRPVLVPAREIISAINRTYGQADDTAEQIIQDLGEEEGQFLFTELEGGADLLDETSEAPIIKLVNQIFSQAVKSSASDIHIEPYEKTLRVRRPGSAG